MFIDLTGKREGGNKCRSLAALNCTLSEDWDLRKKEIGFFDDKPFWLDSSSAKNRFYYDFGDGDGPPETLEVDKHSPHFMNLCGLCWKDKVFSLSFC